MQYIPCNSALLAQEALLKIFVRVQTFRRGPPALPRNFCHPGGNIYISHGRGHEGESNHSDWYHVVLQAFESWHGRGRAFVYFSNKLRFWQPTKIIGSCTFQQGQINYNQSLDLTQEHFPKDVKDHFLSLGFDNQNSRSTFLFQLIQFQLNASPMIQWPG